MVRGLGNSRGFRLPTIEALARDYWASTKQEKGSVLLPLFVIGERGLETRHIAALDPDYVWARCREPWEADVKVQPADYDWSTFFFEQFDWRMLRAETLPITFWRRMHWGYWDLFGEESDTALEDYLTDGLRRNPKLIALREALRALRITQTECPEELEELRKRYRYLKLRQQNSQGLKLPRHLKRAESVSYDEPSENTSITLMQCYWFQPVCKLVNRIDAMPEAEKAAYPPGYLEALKEHLIKTLKVTLAELEPHTKPVTKETQQASFFLGELAHRKDVHAKETTSPTKRPEFNGILQGSQPLATAEAAPYWSMLNALFYETLGEHAEAAKFFARHVHGTEPMVHFPALKRPIETWTNTVTLKTLKTVYDQPSQRWSEELVSTKVITVSIEDSLSLDAHKKLRAVFNRLCPWEDNGPIVVGRTRTTFEDNHRLGVEFDRYYLHGTKATPRDPYREGKAPAEALTLPASVYGFHQLLLTDSLRADPVTRRDFKNPNALEAPLMKATRKSATQTDRLRFIRSCKNNELLVDFMCFLHQPTFDHLREARGNWTDKTRYCMWSLDEDNAFTARYTTARWSALLNAFMTQLLRNTIGEKVVDPSVQKAIVTYYIATLVDLVLTHQSADDNNPYNAVLAEHRDTFEELLARLHCQTETHVELTPEEKGAIKAFNDTPMVKALEAHPSNYPAQANKPRGACACLFDLLFGALRHFFARFNLPDDARVGRTRVTTTKATCPPTPQKFPPALTR